MSDKELYPLKNRENNVKFYYCFQYESNLDQKKEKRKQLKTYFDCIILQKMR